MNFIREVALNGSLLGVVDNLLRCGQEKVCSFIDATFVTPIDVDLTPANNNMLKRSSKDLSDSSTECITGGELKKVRPNNSSDMIYSSPSASCGDSSTTVMKDLFGSPDFMMLFNTAIKSAVKEVMGSQGGTPSQAHFSNCISSSESEDKENDAPIPHDFSEEELKALVKELTMAPMPKEGKFTPKEAIDFVKLYRKFLKFAPASPPNVRYCECSDCIRCRGRIHHNHVSKNLRIGADCSCPKCRTHRLFQVDAARLDYVMAISFRQFYDMTYPNRKDEFDKATKMFTVSKRNRFVLPSRRGSAYIDFNSFEDGPKF